MVILLYHGIVKRGLPCYGRYSLDEETFKKQMLYIKENRYNVLPLKNVVEILNSRSNFPEKSLAITFDDGLLNQFEVAYPILKELNIPACFFIIPTKIERPNYMSWSQVKVLLKNNMEIGSHGLTHQLLDLKNELRILEELEISKKLLEENLNIRIDYLSYPRGCLDTKKIRNLSKKVGYKLVCLSKAGYISPSSDILSLNRFALRRNTTFSDFIQILKNSYLKLLSFRVRERYLEYLKKTLGLRNYEILRKKLLKKEYLNEPPFPE